MRVTPFLVAMVSVTLIIPSCEIIQYQTEDGVTVIRLQASDGSVWLSQAEMAELFQTTKQSISLHVRNILEEGELEEAATVKENLTVQTEGKRKVSRLSMSSDGIWAEPRVIFA